MTQFQDDDTNGAMLSGFGSVGDAMFESLGKPDRTKLLPDPNEMRRKMDAAQFIRRADVKCIQAFTYDLSNPDDRQRYCIHREHLYIGTAMSTHVLLQYERKLVPDFNPPRTVVFMEWMELELKETAVQPVPSSDEG